MSAVSRNASCPCGSGQKYKKCCRPTDEARQKPQTGEDALLILQPTRGTICYETQVALDLNIGTRNYRTLRIARKPVAVARNLLAKYALEAIEKGDLFDFTRRETFVLWVDDDAWLPPGLVPEMVQAMNDPRLARLDALFAWFCVRAPYSKPVAYRNIDDPESFPKIGIDCKHGDVVPVQASGFHCVIMRPRLLQRIGENPFTPNPDYDEGEDWAFCRRAKAIGAVMAVGTALPAAHVDPRDGVAYMVGMPAGMMDGNGMRSLDTQHMVNGELKTGEIRAYGLTQAKTAFQKASAETEAALKSELEQRRGLFDNPTMAGAIS